MEISGLVAWRQGFVGNCYEFCDGEVRGKVLAAATKRVMKDAAMHRAKREL